MVILSWRKQRRRCVLSKQSSQMVVCVCHRQSSCRFDWRVSLLARSGISLVFVASICDDGVIVGSTLNQPKSKSARSKLLLWTWQWCFRLVSWCRQCLGQWLLFIFFFSSIAAWDGLFSLSSCLHDCLVCLCVCCCVQFELRARLYTSRRTHFLLLFRGRSRVPHLESWRERARKICARFSVWPFENGWERGG